MTDFFSQIKGGFSVHVEEDGFTGVRFCLARFGEDPDKVLAQFWRENSGGGDFELVPLFSYGAAPRAELCSQRSLAAALQISDHRVRLKDGAAVASRRRSARRGLAY